jgi:hypothetical protein
MLRRGLLRRELVVIVLAAAALGACGTGPPVTVSTTLEFFRRRRHTAGTATGPSGSRPVATRAATPYRLYTHCGIDKARIGYRYFEAVYPLSDGQGNPPAGWGNPFQQGTMTLLSPSEASFRDDAGHHVLFRLRPGATSFKHLCS